MAAAAADPVDFVVVGCGCPKKSMGWYHLTQLFEMPRARVVAVVEPWYMGAGSGAPGFEEFAKFKEELEAKGVSVFASVSELTPTTGRPLCVLIAGRTADNPRFFNECVDKGATHIYLEKPGAPSVAELQAMRDAAVERGVGVFVGFNKNVSKYVSEALSCYNSTPGATVIAIHNNAYTAADLPECFERNSEGLLKNMAIHELCLLVTYFGVTCDSIDSVDVVPEDSVREIIGSFTDFTKVAFYVTTKEGKRVGVRADRCGGNNSQVIVQADGRDVLRTIVPDEALSARIAEQQAADPEIMPYFLLQSDDYLTLKERVLTHIATGAPAEGVCTIGIALETLKVAELLNERLAAALPVATA